MTKDQLAARLREVWSRETTSDPLAWSPANPAWGQCAVTACVVQDHFGGTVVWAEAMLPDGRRISHYFNNLAGEVLDFTRDQFPEGTVIPEGKEKRNGFPTTRDYVLSFEVTRKRYATLAGAVFAK